MSDTNCLFRPDWALPADVHAFVTTRFGGHSLGPWSSFNLAQHAGDVPSAVTANCHLLLDRLHKETGVAVPAIQWVQQVHGTRVFHAGATVLIPTPEADALYASDSPLALAVLTADCLPVLFSSVDGRELAVAHAGPSRPNAVIANFKKDRLVVRSFEERGWPAGWGRQVRARFLTVAGKPMRELGYLV